MVLVEFEARVRADRLIGFYCPTSILPGQKCSFQTTISQPSPPDGGAQTVDRVRSWDGPDPLEIPSSENT